MISWLRSRSVASKRYWKVNLMDIWAMINMNSPAAIMPEMATIKEQIKDVYKFDVSGPTISRITAKVTDDIVAWQTHPLEPVYLIVWMDGIVFKVRENSKVTNKTIYIAVGLRRDGYKEVLGMWLSKKSLE